MKVDDHANVLGVAEHLIGECVSHHHWLCLGASQDMDCKKIPHTPASC